MSDDGVHDGGTPLVAHAGAEVSVGEDVDDRVKGGLLQQLVDRPLCSVD